MKCYYILLPFLCFCSVLSFAQTETHNTMFMFNKLLYNSAYAGSREVTSVNAYYRDQWNAIEGAPKTYGFTFDAPVGNYNKPFREIALGLSFNNEQIGVELKQTATAYYSIRFKQRDESVLAFGLQGGAQLYSASYGQLNPYQQSDPNLVKDIKSAFLPNFGAGFFWYSENFYLGASIPNILENYYDKNEKFHNNTRSKQVRGYYLNAGYVFHANESIDVLPQLMVRYAGDGTYKLPINCDINISAIIYQRLLLGFTFRTDKSFEGILHLQVTKNINVGYSYDYLVSALSGYNNGAHELVVGFDLVRGNSKYDKAHFIKSF